MKRALWLLVGPLLIAQAACVTDGTSFDAGTTTPVPIKDALATLEGQLRDAMVVNFSDASTSNRPQLIRFLISHECAANSTNPYIPTITGPINLQLQGSFFVQPGVTVTAPPSFSISVNRAKQQQITVPLTMVSLNHLAAFYEGQQLATLANLDAGTSAKNVRMAAIAKDVQALETAISEAQADYPKIQCSDYPLSGLGNPMLE